MSVSSESSRRTAVTALTPELLAQSRVDFARLLRRYKQLTWASSADQQRERAALQKPLMELYCRIEPTVQWHIDDDFDMIMRTR